MLSLPDAIFTARFILLTHELGAHNFSSLSFFDKILEDVSPVVFSCTANEAKCYGPYPEGPGRELGRPSTDAGRIPAPHDARERPGRWRGGGAVP